MHHFSSLLRLVTAPKRRKPAAQWASSSSFRRRQPIVAIVDGSEAALNAAWRAALIAQNWGAPVHVLTHW